LGLIISLSKGQVSVQMLAVMKFSIERVRMVVAGVIKKHGVSKSGYGIVIVRSRSHRLRRERQSGTQVVAEL
jgi:hypothetical protein